MRKLLSVAAIVGGVSLAHCATTSSPKVVTTQSTATIESSAGTDVLTINRTIGVQQLELPASLARSWAVLPDVYRDLGLPVNSADSTQHVLGSLQQQLRRIGGRGMGSLFDCPGAYENLASSGDVIVSIQTQLLADGPATQAHTTFVAYARGRNTSQKVPCQSLGRVESMFETRLHALVQPPDSSGSHPPNGAP